MLVLQRKSDEKIDIFASKSDHIQVIVLKVVGDKVRLGFKAADSTEIYRAEITLAIAQREQGEAAVA